MSREHNYTTVQYGNYSIKIYPGENLQSTVDFLKRCYLKDKYLQKLIDNNYYHIWNPRFLTCDLCGISKRDWDYDFSHEKKICTGRLPV